MKCRATASPRYEPIRNSRASATRRSSAAWAAPWRYHDVYCAGNEKVFEFIDGVFTELCELFPSPWIHVGGDECPKDRWKACPKCQARIKEEGLKDEFELQSYFVKRVSKILQSKGRRLIGWDEILEGGLAPGCHRPGMA